MELTKEEKAKLSAEVTPIITSMATSMLVSAQKLRLLLRVWQQVCLYLLHLLKLLNF